jgi:hypothetical protein
MYETYLTIGLVIYGIDRLVNWYHLYTLRGFGEDYLFPDSDPIRTSSLDSFTYEEEQEQIPPNWEYDAPEEEEVPVAAPVTFDLDGPVADVVRREREENEQFHSMVSDLEAVLPEIEEPEVYTYEGYELVYDKTRCMGLTKYGRQCSRLAKQGEKYCHIHKE